jgi:hypothetical protein
MLDWLVIWLCAGTSSKTASEENSSMAAAMSLFRRASARRATTRRIIGEAVSPTVDSRKSVGHWPGGSCSCCQLATPGVPVVDPPFDLAWRLKLTAPALRTWPGPNMPGVSVKNRMALVVSPRIRVGSDLLSFGQVGYHWASTSCSACQVYQCQPRIASM